MTENQAAYHRRRFDLHFDLHAAKKVLVFGLFGRINRGVFGNRKTLGPLRPKGFRW